MYYWWLGMNIEKYIGNYTVTLLQLFDSRFYIVSNNSKPVDEKRFNDFWWHYLQVQMHNVLFVHVIYAFAYLSSEQNTVFFGQCEIVGHHSFEQFSARNTEII